MRLISRCFVVFALACGCSSDPTPVDASSPADVPGAEVGRMDVSADAPLADRGTPMDTAPEAAADVSDGAVDAARQDAVVDASGGGDGGLNTDAIRPAVEAYCSLRARALCEGNAACSRGLPSAVIACTGRARQNCIDALLVPNDSYRLVENLVAGRMRIDMAAATTCFSAPVLAFCRTNNIEAGDPACERIFVGTLRVGDLCSVGFGQGNGPCAEGHCPIFPTVCPARCTAYRTVGMSCGPTPESLEVCATGLTCVSGTCSALPARGAACTGACAGNLACRVLADAGGATCEPLSSTGGYCAVSTDCVSGLCVSGTCRDRAMAMGDRCEARPHCPTGLGCYDTDPSATVAMTCQPDLAVGALCTPDASRCGPGLRCDGAGAAARCVIPEPEVGQPCFAGACATGLACVSGTCQSPAPLGGRCDAAVPYAACAAPGFCGVDSVCHAAGELAGTCRASNARSCVAGLFCGADNRCARPVAAGATCDPTLVGQCAAGFGCVMNRCTATIPRGTACTVAEQCAEGLCIDGRCTGPCPGR